MRSTTRRRVRASWRPGRRRVVESRRGAANQRLDFVAMAFCWGGRSTAKPIRVLFRISMVVRQLHLIDGHFGVFLAFARRLKCVAIVGVVLVEELPKLSHLGSVLVREPLLLDCLPIALRGFVETAQLLPRSAEIVEDPAQGAAIVQLVGIVVDKLRHDRLGAFKGAVGLFGLFGLAVQASEVVVADGQIAVETDDRRGLAHELFLDGDGLPIRGFGLLQPAVMVFQGAEVVVAQCQIALIFGVRRMRGDELLLNRPRLARRFLRLDRIGFRLEKTQIVIADGQVVMIVGIVGKAMDELLLEADGFLVGPLGLWRLAGGRWPAGPNCRR